MSDVKVISLTTAEDSEDENFSDFVNSLKNDNDSAVFMISRKDGTMAVGSTYKNVKDLVWDCERLKLFMQNLVRNGLAE